MSDDTRGKNEDGKLLYCSFCGKSQHEVRKLIAGPSVFICDECVELCNDIIREEVILVELSDEDKRYLGIPYETDIIIASPNLPDDSRYYFGKRYKQTAASELTSVIESAQTQYGYSLTCLSDIIDIIKAGVDRALLDALASYCPKQHIFFNASALGKIEQAMREWRNEEHADFD